ncbi:MAG: hypothetical protein AAF556_04945 [Pseudomonadota bacterium]
MPPNAFRPGASADGQPLNAEFQRPGGPPQDGPDDGDTSFGNPSSGNPGGPGGGRPGPGGRPDMRPGGRPEGPPNPDVTVIIGTDDADTLTGGDDDDVFIGSAGSDLITGGAGADVVDYSDLGGPVTLLTAGLVDKGDLGTDTLGSFDNDTGTLEVIETVIGARGERNVVDGTSEQGAVSIDVDLTTGTFTATVVEDTFAFEEGDSFSLSLRGFSDVLGSDNNDAITGNNRDNLLTGADGADTINGAGGADTIDGGAGDDLLTGGRGPDIFQITLGDGSDVIVDFEVGSDMLVLSGVALGNITATTDGTNTLVDYDDGDILLTGVVEEDIDALILLV